MLHLIRLPKFPVVVDLGDRLMHARTRAQLEARLVQTKLVGNERRRIIDATAEGFLFDPERKLIVPSVSIRRWTKQQIIDLYNQKRQAGTPELGNASLGNRSLQRIVLEVVELLARR